MWEKLFSSGSSINNTFQHIINDRRVIVEISLHTFLGENVESQCDGGHGLIRVFAMAAFPKFEK